MKVGNSKVSRTSRLASQSNWIVYLKQFQHGKALNYKENGWKWTEISLKTCKFTWQLLLETKEHVKLVKETIKTVLLHSKVSKWLKKSKHHTQK